MLADRISKSSSHNSVTVSSLLTCQIFDTQQDDGQGDDDVKDLQALLEGFKSQLSRLDKEVSEKVQDLLCLSNLHAILYSLLSHCNLLSHCCCMLH